MYFLINDRRFDIVLVSEDGETKYPLEMTRPTFDIHTGLMEFRLSIDINKFRSENGELPNLDFGFERKGDHYE